MDLGDQFFPSTTEILSTDPFTLEKFEKDCLMQKAMQELSDHHTENCWSYSQIVKLLSGSLKWDTNDLQNLPFIPVRLFKHLELRSIPEEDVFKELLSSGTSGQNPSRIFLDRHTAQKQSVTLAKLFKEFIGLNRPPILIVDAPDTIKNRSSFSARTAGILGFSYLGRDLTFALRNDFTIDLEAVARFLAKHENEDILIFGFTSIVWEFFMNSIPLLESGLKFPKATLLHGGGWKKLVDLNIDIDTFNESLIAKLQVNRVVNYYGLVEQTGSVFFECVSGFFHCSNYSNIIIREPSSFEVLGFGKIGVLQLQSVLPLSYPGHSILTEDLGEILGIDDCECGRLGQRFKVHGRVPEAEVRGCSDTFER